MTKDEALKMCLEYIETNAQGSKFAILIKETLAKPKQLREENEKKQEESNAKLLKDFQQFQEDDLKLITEQNEKKKKLAQDQADLALKIGKEAASGNRDLLEASKKVLKGIIKEEIQMHVAKAQAELSLIAAANWWNPVGWGSIAAIAGLEIIKNEAFSAIDKFKDGGIIGGSSPVGDTRMIRANTGEVVLNKSQQENIMAMATGGGLSGGGGSGSNSSVMRQLQRIEDALLADREIKLNGDSFTKAVYTTQKKMIRNGQLSEKA